MPQINLEAVLKSKAPNLSRWVPRFAVNWLRRTVHEDVINHILDNYSSLPPQEFIRACFREWGVSYSIHGIEELPRDGRYLFVANHPFGGMDGMMLADKLMEHFGDVRVVVNDLLMNIKPLSPLWIPVNKHGNQTTGYVQKFDEEFYGDRPILTFPAGLCSRKIDGRVQDTEWKVSFLKKAYTTQRVIVPVFVEGRLSEFFYRISRLRKWLGMKFNLEMVWLPDEMLRQKGRHFRIIVGRPIAIADLQHLPSLREQVEEVRRRTYDLEKNLV